MSYFPPHDVIFQKVLNHLSLLKSGLLSRHPSLPVSNAHNARSDKNKADYGGEKRAELPQKLREPADSLDRCGSVVLLLILAALSVC